MFYFTVLTLEIGGWDVKDFMQKRADNGVAELLHHQNLIYLRVENKWLESNNKIIKFIVDHAEIRADFLIKKSPIDSTLLFRRCRL